MRIIRLVDPRPNRPALPFGTSEWAAESCLAEWSQFEREWLGPDPRGRSGKRRVSPLVALVLGILAGAALVAVGALLIAG
jgi:hypothetical protein